MPKPFFNSKSTIDEIIRVNHAGEFGAKIIYQAQIKYSKDQDQKELITHMMNQEQIHLDFFEEEAKQNNVRPTFLLPVWRRIGYLLGAFSALAGKEIAMLLTESIESVIELHYNEQIEYLDNAKCNDYLKDKITKFRLEEIEHKNIAIDNDSKHAFCYKIINSSIENLCKIAILLSKKI